MKEEIVKLTAAAADRMKTIIAERDKPSAGIRLTVSTKGCSGMSYNLDYADEKTPSDEVIQHKGITLFIDPKAVMFILGSEIDFVKDKLQSRIVFYNPQEKGRCGCGESFHV